MMMQDLISQLTELNKISSQLEFSETARNQMVREAEEFANKFLSGLDEVKCYDEKQPDTSVLAINNQKSSFESLLTIYKEQVAETGINAASAKHFGYIPGGGIFSSAVADFIAAVTNPYASVWYASPGAAAIENEVITWLKSIFSFPEHSVGNLASGGSVSTLIAFTAARDKYQIKNEKIKTSVVYLSEQVHHAAQKALRIIGLEDVIIRYVPLDENHRINSTILRELIKKDQSEDLHPFLVVGTAGTTNTGCVDPLDEIAEIAEENNLWFHVDAAYGGFFILTSRKELFKGIERADSIIMDPHKSLFIPYGLGAVLIKDRKTVLHSNHYAASYMQDSEIEDLALSSSNLSPELTKHFRGLRLWLPLKLHGIAPFKAALEEKLLLVKYFRQLLIEKGFKTGPEPDLSISYFWYPFEKDINKKNQQLMEAIHNNGDAFLSSTIINGQFVIRIAILSFRTKKHHIDQAMEMIERCLVRSK